MLLLLATTAIPSILAAGVWGLRVGVLGLGKELAA